MAGKTFYVDISSHQEDGNKIINLRAYWNAGYRYLMVKASEGMDYRWDRAIALAREWHSYGGAVGYYHWLYPNLSGASQFNFYWGHIAQVFIPNRDWMMIDYEDTQRYATPGQHVASLDGFYKLAKARGECDIYTGNWYLEAKPATVAWLRGKRVVMSDYSHATPNNPYGLTYSAHQYTDNAQVSGFVGGGVDANYWIDPPYQGESVSSGTAVEVDTTHKDWSDMATQAQVMQAASDGAVRAILATLTGKTNVTVKQPAMAKMLHDAFLSEMNLYASGGIYIKFINSGPKNNQAAIYQVVGDELVYIDNVNYSFAGQPAVRAVDNRSRYWSLPVRKGSPDYRGK